MKLLFLTQVLDADDAVLGFVSRWVAGLARSAERVRVIALEVGETSDLPDNVDWRVLGRKGTLSRWWRNRRFLSEAYGADGFDAALAHMVPRYALLAEGPTRKAGKGLFLWYTHKGVDARLRRAVPLCDTVFTASDESMRIESPNKRVTGHGIDLAHFETLEPPDLPARLLSVGRLTPAKDQLTIVDALHQLVQRGHDLHLDLVGGGLAAGDDDYGRKVQARIAEYGLGERVVLHGPVPYPKVPELFRRSTAFVSASLTGSVDKVVLEAMASRRPVVTCNEACASILEELGERGRSMCYGHADAEALAAALDPLLCASADERARLGAELRAIVERDHEVDRLMSRLVAEMQSKMEGAS